MLSQRFLRALGNGAFLGRPTHIQPACKNAILPVACRTSSLRLQQQICRASSASSTRWKTRQANDPYAREARVAGLKGRAAFKLLQINDKHRILKKGDTVVDLGFAPGSWSQVAANRTYPGGRVIGVDVLPAQPPPGVSTIQGDFLSPDIQKEVRAYVQDYDRGRAKVRSVSRDDDSEGIDVEQPGYIDMERNQELDATDEEDPFAQDELEVVFEGPQADHRSQKQRDRDRGWVVDVVLSDMCEPWEQTTGLWVKSISNPYHRMMNTSGVPFRDHAGSMDLCYAALLFCFDTLRTGGSFVCKFYQGNEEKLLEKRLRTLFSKVHREKPPASRQESREGYFVCLRRREGPSKEEIFTE